VCDLETSKIGAPYIYDISNLRVKIAQCNWECIAPLTQENGSLLMEWRT